MYDYTFTVKHVRTEEWIKVTIERSGSENEAVIRLRDMFDMDVFGPMVRWELVDAETISEDRRCKADWDEFKAEGN